ncbi:glycosyl hydrolase family 88 [Melioribacter roseus P3M-2]|uniref:Glycosyl hydrolase family 88 n=1 Tax=Melioribacter roseus (strain DSM 23840 / JCM 17771 / VKM B-2668 / P3M-2) TaxID=1191523 RepID=I7A012_MELRP|nr:glycoside hydrolase family 88 protein [Melioribacter roseus]AFN73321.1 glycosyl hydrolase family 88 [Melioribacter roseus P3M-2]
MKRVIYFTLILFISTLALAQNKNEDEKIIRKVADYIVEHGVLGFKDLNTGKVYSSTKDAPEDAALRFISPFGEWHYTNGVINMALINLSEFTGDKKYADYAAAHVAFGMDNYKYFQARYNKEKDGPHYHFPFGQLWTMRELDDCGAMGASMMDVYEFVKRDDYKKYIEDAARHISEGQERLEDGTLVRRFPHEMTLWADDLYMSVPFLARMGKFSGDTKYWDDAILQIKNFTKYLWDDNKELYWHCYYTDVERNGVAHWGRCNGWVMMAKVHLLNILPEDYPGREEVRKDLERQILGIAKYQNPEGLWHQLLDKNDSYLESSCSAMFVYSIARAVNQGWIDKRYASVALKGWEGLKKLKIRSDGQVKDICVGTGIEDNLVFYYERPARLNEKHGIGSVIDAGIEVVKLKENLKNN